MTILLLHDWVSIVFCICGLITYNANVKWLIPVTWSLYGFYFISTIVIINSRRKNMKSMKLALRKTMWDICIVSTPVVIYIGWAVKLLVCKN